MRSGAGAAIPSGMIGRLTVIAAKRAGEADRDD